MHKVSFLSSDIWLEMKRFNESRPVLRGARSACYKQEVRLRRMTVLWRHFKGTGRGALGNPRTSSGSGAPRGRAWTVLFRFELFTRMLFITSSGFGPQEWKFRIDCIRTPTSTPETLFRKWMLSSSRCTHYPNLLSLDRVLWVRIELEVCMSVRRELTFDHTPRGREMVTTNVAWWSFDKILVVWFQFTA